MDWNADAPLCAAARAAMLDAWEHGALNPSSAHAGGQKARAILEDARQKMARLLNCQAGEIIFTGSGTEADNMAVKGALIDGAPARRIIVSFMEHPAVVRPAKASNRPVSFIEVDAGGVINLAALKRQLEADAAPALVCVMFASNETGALQPVREAARIAHEYGARILCDAVQGAGKADVDFAALDVDYLAISAHKFGGPQGAGALIVREGLALEPLIHGGGQERKRRAGTENVAGIAGMAAALESSLEDRAEKDSRIKALRARLESGLQDILPGVVIFSGDAPRLSNTTFFAHPGLEAATALMAFDLDGVSISAGSACHSGKAEASRALKAMGVDKALAARALRVSLGPDNTQDDISLFLNSLKRQAARIRANAA